MLYVSACTLLLVLLIRRQDGCATIAAMKLLLALSTALALASNVGAHYIFIQFSAGTKKFAQYEHIRKNVNNNSPVTGNLAHPRRAS